MKISIKYSILIIFTILHLNGCNKDNTVEPVIPPIITLLPVTITGHIYGDSIPLEGAVLTMDSLTTITDTSGYYVFANVKGDTFHIAVSHPEFGVYELDVYRENPTVQDINLTRTHYDYFPLNTGNKWKFSYTSGGYAGSIPSGYTFWSEGGTIRWEIKTKKFVTPNWEYTVSEIYYDSSGVIVHDTTFSLVYSTNKKVRAKGWSRILNSSMEFDRYEVITLSETKYYPVSTGGNIAYTIKRRTGIIQYRNSYGGITYGSHAYADLLEFTGH